MAPTRRFLITGATGKQGGAVVNSLLEYRTKLPSDQKFEILCLTRDTTSEKAVSLASNEGVSAVPGNLFFPLSTFDKVSPIDAVFCMTCPGDLGDEERQATSLIDASITHGVKHFVFTSVDRGGAEVSETNPTEIPHFKSKYNVEKYLKEKCAESQMTWTILRPVGFMDNLMPNFTGRGFTAIWAQIGKKPLQLVSARDIGHFGALALLRPEEYAGRAVGLAGDELNFETAQRVFRETMGYEMPRTWTFVASLIAFALPEMGQMFKWLKEEGYAVDIKGLREEYPELQDFRTWLQESSQHERNLQG
ncbi:hypothetical protein VE03_09374 [Pseudogymnoascus sp. 23342-1-I1]|nr:hypothetical protein VE03_09374 [Pseudogymnoascus sp. 23342-1-I1]